MSKKTILMASLVLAFIVGCQQQNLTWTPTAEEWAAMTPEQRNAWSANERRARQDNWNSIQKNLDDISRRDRERRESETITIIPTQNQNRNSTYWQERRARQEVLGW